MEKNNIFENLPDSTTEEIFETLLEDNRYKIERIVSEGQATAPDQWYDQDWDEWVILLQGSAGILFEGDEAASVLRPGDYLFIPVHTRHRVEWAVRGEKTIWLAIHMKQAKSEK